MNIRLPSSRGKPFRSKLEPFVELIRDLRRKRHSYVLGIMTGGIRVMEITDHPFYLGTLFVPQSRSTMEEPHPLVSEFLASTSRNKN